MTSTDLFIVGCLVLYLAALSLFTYYAQQNSQPARRLAEELVESTAVDAGFYELAQAVCAPRPGGED